MFIDKYVLLNSIFIKNNKKTKDFLLQISSILNNSKHYSKYNYFEDTFKIKDYDCKIIIISEIKKKMELFY